MNFTPNVSADVSPAPRVLLAATFTADPIVESLSVLLSHTGLGLPVEVAPYGQAFQQLLDPTSGFSRNREGVNVVLLRFEDWLRTHDGGTAPLLENRESLERNVADLAAALQRSAAAATSSLVLMLCPASPSLLADPNASALLASLEQTLREQFSGVAGLHILSPDMAAQGHAIHDQEGDRLGHVPYTRTCFAELGRALARLIHSLKRPPMKVIVLDCDNTLWKGVVGEDGIHGIQITPGFKGLQRFVLQKKHSGMLLCLASKNTEEDVLAVFKERRDMVLGLDDIVAMRVNWSPKSQNIAELAGELNLGLDSFVFIDDNPVECAEVAAGCPGVLVLQLPSDDEAVSFLENVWPLDVCNVTKEDRQRSDMMRENLARDRLARSSTSLSGFLASLDLRITIDKPTPEQVPRVAQLTQRTNQFNFTTRRRTEAEVAAFVQEGGEIRVVHVKDRFGDYGLVGVMMARPLAHALSIDTFLLSCRALGRGVEHAMLRGLGELARSLGLADIEIPFLTSQKNLPARRFLDGLAVDSRDERADGVQIRVATDRACALTYAPGETPVDIPSEGEAKRAPARNLTKPADWSNLARRLAHPQGMLALLHQESQRVRTSSQPVVPARTGTERKLCAIWSEVLRIPSVSIHDNYADDLGGTSLDAVSIFARIDRELGVKLPLVALVEAPTIAGLAAKIDRPSERLSLVPLQTGGSDVPLFLVHDADGETLLYRNLARRLHTRPVYAIQPHGTPEVPIVHTRLVDMAAHYVAEMRKVRPHGPYLLGGLCAGGVIALEVALQLEAQGETARLVAVFDAADVEAAPVPHLESHRRLESFRKGVSQGSMGQRALALLNKVRGFASFRIRQRLRQAKGQLAVRSLRACMDHQFPPVPWARGLRVRDVYLVAEKEYRPNQTLQHDIVLFRASQGEGAEEPYIQRYSDPLLGWSKRTQGQVRAFDVPGGHGSMLQEPHAAAVARLLSDYLQEIESDSTAASVLAAKTGIP